MNPKIELISFELCPFVQRSAILLSEKGVPFSTTYIDLTHKPQWFLKISPLGKVPAMRIGEQVLFESMVIAEYLDEAYPPSLHPTDLIEKALNRAWIEYSSTLFMDLYLLCGTTDQGSFNTSLQNITDKLQKLETHYAGSTYYNGDQPMLIDFCIAPLFQRIELIAKAAGPSLLKDCPKLRTWSAHILARPAVKDSLPEKFDKKYLFYLQHQDSYLAKQLKT